MNHWVEILEMNLSVGVSQSSGITFRSGIETRLELQVVKVGVQSALLVVVVHLALTQIDMADAKIEYARLAFAAAFPFRKVGVATVRNKHMDDGMIGDDVLQIPLLRK